MPVSLERTRALQLAIERNEYNVEECYYSPNYPTLAELAAGGEQARRELMSFLILLLFEIGEASGARDKMNEHQLKVAEGDLVREFYFLRTSELLLFAVRFRTGRYGRFYGSVDSMIIFGALREFIAERNEEMDRYDKEHRAAVSEINRRGAVSRERYLEMVANGERIEPVKLVTLEEYLAWRFADGSYGNYGNNGSYGKG